mgnify:CR=1 FL=1
MLTSSLYQMTNLVIWLIKVTSIQLLQNSLTKSKRHSDVTVNGVTYKDKIYAFPKSTESLVLFYNKSKLSADDVKTWEGMTAKAGFAANYTDPYYSYPVFLQLAQPFSVNQRRCEIY